MQAEYLFNPLCTLINVALHIKSVRENRCLYVVFLVSVAKPFARF